MSKVYSGIGHRGISEPIKAVLYRIGQAMAESGYILRSGAADGADTAFEKGALSVGGKTEIYLPWKRFNGHPSSLYYLDPRTFKIAEGHHNYWHNVKPGAKKLLARDVNILIGEKLDKPSDLCLYWADKSTGGTRHTVRIADTFKIPCYNLAEYETTELMKVLGL